MHLHPLVSKNSLSSTLKYLDDDDIYEYVSDQTLKDIFNDLLKEKNEIEEYNRCVKAWRRFIKSKNVICFCVCAGLRR